MPRGRRQDAAAEVRLGLGPEAPVVAGHVHRVGERRRHLDERPPVAAAVLDDDDRMPRLAQPVGEGGAGGAGADDDVVRLHSGLGGLQHVVVDHDVLGVGRALAEPGVVGGQPRELAAVDVAGEVAVERQADLDVGRREVAPEDPGALAELRLEDVEVPLEAAPAPPRPAGRPRASARRPGGGSSPGASPCPIRPTCPPARAPPDPPARRGSGRGGRRGSAGWRRSRTSSRARPGAWGRGRWGSSPGTRACRCRRSSARRRGGRRRGRARRWSTSPPGR